jgi:hypothetical protein
MFSSLATSGTLPSPVADVYSGHTRFSVPSVTAFPSPEVCGERAARDGGDFAPRFVPAWCQMHRAGHIGCEGAGEPSTKAGLAFVRACAGTPTDASARGQACLIGWSGLSVFECRARGYRERDQRLNTQGRRYLTEEGSPEVVSADAAKVSIRVVTATRGWEWPPWSCCWCCACPGMPRPPA